MDFSEWLTAPATEGQSRTCALLGTESHRVFLSSLSKQKIKMDRSGFSLL